MSIWIGRGVLILDGQRRVDGEIHPLAVDGGCVEKQVTVRSRYLKRDKSIIGQQRWFIYRSFRRSFCWIHGCRFLSRSSHWCRGTASFRFPGTRHAAGRLPSWACTDCTAIDSLTSPPKREHYVITDKPKKIVILCAASLFFCSYLYDSYLAVVLLYGLIEILHHVLKLVRFLIDSGCFGHVW